MGRCIWVSAACPMQWEGGHSAVSVPAALLCWLGSLHGSRFPQLPPLLPPQLLTQQPSHTDDSTVWDPQPWLWETNPLMMEDFQNSGWSLIRKNRRKQRRPGSGLDLLMADLPVSGKVT